MHGLTKFMTIKSLIYLSNSTSATAYLLVEEAP